METTNCQSADVRSRDRWPSRTAFLIAAVGCAVGIGNLWRFPYLSFKYGGGAFFIPYLLALVIVAVPLLQLEFMLGQVSQGGCLVAFNYLHERNRGLGVGCSLLAFCTATYYSTILGWSLLYLLHSFEDPLPWAVRASDAALCPGIPDQIACAANAACEWNDEAGGCMSAVLNVAREFFYHVVNFDENSAANFSLQGSGALVAALAVVWLCVAAALAKGAKVLGYLVYVTMVLPFLLLVVLVVRGVTLEGAGEGIRQYIGQWDLHVLVDNPEIWSAATGQIFFSVGVAFGCMSAYASFNSKHQNAVQDAWIVCLVNSFVSLVSGFAVFSIAGFLSHTSGQSLEEMKSAGIGLAFWTFPTGLAQLPAPAAQIFCVLFFVTFFLLGIDSAFGLVESELTMFTDSRITKRIPRLAVVVGLALAGLAVGLPYCANIGMYLIDVVDFYLSNIAAVFLGMCECLAAGWFFGIDRQREEVGTAAVLSYNLGFALSVGVGLPLVVTLPGFEKLTGVAVLLAGLAITLGCSMMLVEKNQEDGASPMFKLILGNIEDLRKFLNSVAGKDRGLGCIRVPRVLSELTIIWSLLLKYVIPVLLYGLLCLTMNSEKFLDYEGLESKYQIVGVGLATLAVAAVAVGWLFPCWLRPLLPVNGQTEKPLEVGPCTVAATSNSGMSFAAEEGIMV